MQPSVAHLAEVLRQDASLGLVFERSGLNGHQSSRTIPQALKYYSADAPTRAIIEHDYRWDLGERLRPTFQFGYLMLPALCSQRCSDCLTEHDKKRFPEHLS